MTMQELTQGELSVEECIAAVMRYDHSAMFRSAGAGKFAVIGRRYLSDCFYQHEHDAAWRDAYSKLPPVLTPQSETPTNPSPEPQPVEAAPLDDVQPASEDIQLHDRCSTPQGWHQATANNTDAICGEAKETDAITNGMYHVTCPKCLALKASPVQPDVQSLAREIITRLVTTAISCTYSRSLVGGDLEDINEQELIDDALAIALGDEIGCLTEEECPAENIDLLWLEAKLAAAPEPKVIPASQKEDEGTNWMLMVDEVVAEWGQPLYSMTEDGEAWYWCFADHDLPVADNLSELLVAAAQLTAQALTKQAHGNGGTE